MFFYFGEMFRIKYVLGCKKIDIEELTYVLDYTGILHAIDLQPVDVLIID